MNNKYIYEGMSISEYCLQKNMTKELIYSRISYLKKVNPNLSDEELVELVFTTYTPKKEPKYKYEGISLYKYCDQNNIKKFTIYARIKKLKKEYPNLTNEELVKKALSSDFKPDKTIYFLNNTTLYKYCHNNPNVDYNNICRWINEELKKNPNQSIEELIKFKISGHNNKNRWYYLGIPLKEFCLNNDISYGSIRNYLFKMLQKPIYSNWTDEELVTYLVERRFLINGKVLKDYCNSINFSYETMHDLVKEKLQKYPNAKFKTILSSIITTINQYYLINYSEFKEFPNYINNYLNNIEKQSVRNKINESTLTLTR